MLYISFDKQINTQVHSELTYPLYCIVVAGYP